MVKQKLAAIRSWLNNITHSCSTIYDLLSYTAYHEYKHNLTHLTKIIFWPLFKLWLTNFLSLNVYCQLSPIFSRGPGDKQLHSVFYLFLVYDPTESSPFQLTVFRDIIQLNNLKCFVSWNDYHPTLSTPSQLTVGCDVIQLHCSHCNFIQRYLPTKLYHTFILFSVIYV